MPHFYDPARPQINGRPALAGAVLPYFLVRPEPDGEHCSLIFYLAMGANSSRFYSRTIRLESLENCFRRYTQDPELFLLEIFEWSPPFAKNPTHITLDMLLK